MKFRRQVSTKLATALGATVLVKRNHYQISGKRTKQMSRYQHRSVITEKPLGLIYDPKCDQNQTRGTRYPPTIYAKLFIQKCLNLYSQGIEYYKRIIFIFTFLYDVGF